MNAQTAKAEIVAAFTKNIAALETAIAANRTGFIYVWSQYDLGVMIDGDGARAVSVDRATIVRANDCRTIKNGHGIKAMLLPRQPALIAALANARKILAQFA